MRGQSSSRHVARGASVRSKLVIALLGSIMASTALVAHADARATASPSSGSNAFSTSTATATVPSSQPTNRGSNSRTGWYPNQPGLSPSVVDGSHFGQIFNTRVNGQVFAQPLVTSGVLIVATMQDWVYGLSPTTGAIEWSRQIAQPFYQVNAWTIKTEQCNDVGPYVGVLSTPTVDPTTGIIYLMDMQQDVAGVPSYWMQAINPINGQSEPNFPVEVSGNAQNDPSLSFDANLELQRPGLLLLNGRVYAAFSSHCDQSPFFGFVVGVNTSGSISTIWTDVTGNHVGGGIWQSGGGLVQLGNDILLTSGNGFQSPSGTVPGTQPPASLGESVINLSVASDGSLVPVDFFTPYNAAYLDKHDFDFGTGAPILLPPSFGTATYPRIVAQESKEGYVYLLNADSLGGVGNGANGGDNALATVGPYGGVWATPAAFPTSTGGYLYIPTATGGTGSLGNAHQGNFDVYRVDATGSTPTLSEVATAGSAQSGSTAFGYGASSPVVTSNEMNPGTGVVWVVRSSDGLGDDATLQAYSAVPNGKWLTLLHQWPIGLANKFTSPGVWVNKVYTVSQDGHVLGFGATSAPTLRGDGVNFATTIIGQRSVVKTLVVTAEEPLTITSVAIATDPSSSNPPQFQLVGIHPALTSHGLHLAKGATATLSLLFQPNSVPGAVQSTVKIAFGSGKLDLPLTGLAQSSGSLLYGSTTGLDFGGVTLGTTSTQSLHFTNYGATALTWGPTNLPSSGFSIVNAPSPGTILAPGASVTIPVSFTPSVAQSEATSSFTLSTLSASNPQTWTVHLSAYGAAPAQISLSTSSGGDGISFGSIPVGDSNTGSFTITNTGGSTATLARVTPPSSLAFVFSQTLSTGYQLQPGTSVTVNVTFQPDATGPQDATFTFETTTPGSSRYGFTLSGVAVGAGFALPVLSQRAGWTTNGSAAISSGQVSLTPAVPFLAGSSYWPVAVPSNTMTFSYTSSESTGTGADAAALVMANASSSLPTSLGSDGPGLGFNDVSGLGVVLGTYPEPGSPPTTNPKNAGTGWLGVTNGWNNQLNQFNWLGGVNLPAEFGGVQNNPINVTVNIASGTMTIYLDGINELSLSVTLPPSVFIGFAGSTGGLFNSNVISNLRATIAGVAPTAKLTNPSSISLPTTKVGAVSFAPLKISNPGSTPITITSARNSNTDFFTTGATFPLVVAPLSAATLQIGFQPAGPGAQSTNVSLRMPGGATANVGVHARATGQPSRIPSVRQWRRNGHALLDGSSLNLTTLSTFQASSAWSRVLSTSSTTTVSFVPHVTPGNGADGIAILFGSPDVTDTTLGANGWGLGFAPVRSPTLAVVFSEDKEPGAPAANFVGISNGGVNGHLHWLATKALPTTLGAMNTPVSVTSTSSSITIWLNGKVFLTRSGLVIPSSLRLGVSGSNGGLVDLHAVIALRATSP